MIECFSCNFDYVLVVENFASILSHKNHVLEVVLMSKVGGPCVYILGLVYTIHTITFGGRIAAQNFMRGAAVNGDFEGKVYRFAAH